MIQAIATEFNHISLTWFQFFLVPTGSFFHRFTSSTQALQISPDRVSLNLQDSYTLWGENVSCPIGMLKPDTWFLLQPRAHVCILPETAPELLLISFAVRETRAGRLCTADTAAVQTSVHFRLVKAKHLSDKKRFNVNMSDSHHWASCFNCSTLPLLPILLLILHGSRSLPPLQTRDRILLCHFKQKLLDMYRVILLPSESTENMHGEHFLLMHLSALTHMGGSRSTVRQRVRQIMSPRCAHRMHASFWQLKM